MLEELVSGSDWEPGGKLLVDHSEQNAAQITADKVASLADKATRLASMQLCMPVVLTSRSRSRLDNHVFVASHLIERQGWDEEALKLKQLEAF